MLRTPAHRLWFALALATAVKVFVSPAHHSLYPTFHAGTHNWWAGASVYAEHFRYSPVVAPLLSPFTLLPYSLGNVAWNAFSLAVLFVAIRELARHVLPGRWEGRREQWLLSLCLVAAIRPVWSSQSHVLCAALMFLGLARLVQRRWWTCALFLALAVHLKMAPLALALLLVAIRPRQLGFRFFAVLLGIAAAPFLTRGPSYVIEQYRDWFGHLAASHATRWPSNRDVWAAWETLGLPVQVTAYRAVQLALALATVGACLRLRRRLPTERWEVTMTAGLGMTYMLLLGPAVEFVQWVILGPFAAWAVLDAWARRRGRGVATGLFLGMMVFGFGAVERAVARLTGFDQSTVVVTFATALFGVWLLVRAREPAAVGRAAHAARQAEERRPEPRGAIAS